jgi:superfamily II DNA or RNA helicase
VLTEGTQHLEALAERLQGKVKNLVLLRGGMGAKQRRRIAEQLAAVPDDEECVLLATGRYVGEGFDYPRLDTLLLAMPIFWRGTLQQYVGRLHRLHEQKQVVRVYDYVDAEVPVLARMFDKRMRRYKAIGYEVVSHAADQAEEGRQRQATLWAD